MHRLFADLCGAMFAKEAIELARRPGAWFARVAVGLVLLVAVLLAADREAKAPPSEGLRTAQQRVARAQDILWSAVMLEYLALALATPLFVVGAVHSERAAGTLDMLLTTHLSDHEIVFGKFAARAAVLVSVLIGGVPVLALLSLVGGISLFEALFATAMIGIALLPAIAVAMYCSVASGSSWRALGPSYLTVGAIAVTVGAALRATTQAIAASNGWLGSIQALFVLGFLVLVVGLITSALLQSAEGRLRSHLEVILPRPAAQRNGVRGDQDPAKFVPTALATRTAMWGPLRIPLGKDEPRVSQNLWVFGVLGAALAFCSYSLLSAGPEFAARVGILILPLWFCAFGIVSMIAVTNPLYTRRPGFFDHLLGTLLSPGEIMQGTVFVSWPATLRVLALPWTFSLLWIAGNPSGISLGLLIGTSFCAWTIVVGNASSLANPAPLGRLAATLLVPAFAVFGTWYFGTLLPDVRPWQTIVCGAALAIIGAVVARRRTSSIAVGVHALGVYLLLCGLLVMQGLAWFKAPFYANHAAPLLLLNPFNWLSEVLWRRLDEPNRLAGPWAPIGYLAALLVATGWLYWWSGNCFDRWTGRVTCGARRLRDGGSAK